MARSNKNESVATQVDAPASPRATSSKRFAYYSKLSRRDQALYRKSDDDVALSIPDVYPLRAFLPDIRDALEAEDQKKLRPLAQQLTSMLLAQWGAPSVEVRVLKVRPYEGDYEFHGLYEHEAGKRPVVRVWTKTAAHKRPVAFKTFVRTLLHELVHHIDFSLYGYRESFHTGGFYKRESHLVRQLFDDDNAATTRIVAAVVSWKRDVE